MTDLPDISPNLGLPFYLTKQNEFEVQHNEALLILDALVMLSVLDRDLSEPPAEPALGDRYIVASPGTGAFAGKDNRIAQYDIGGWNFYAPQEGWTCYVRDESTLLAWDGESWAAAIDVLGEVSELQNLARLGVGTEADATNPFAAKLNNALWVARTEAEGGDGDLRYKLSKASADNTLSMLFQTGFEGRAEIGLTGVDDFHFKVSADGETWLDAIVIDRETGEVAMPHTAPSGASGDVELALAQLALGLADALNGAQSLGSTGNRFADSFDTLDYVDVAGATGLATSEAGVLKPYRANGVAFDGSTHLTRGAALTGAANSKLWTMSFYVYIDAIGATQRLVAWATTVGGATTRTRINIATDGRVRVFGFDAGGNADINLATSALSAGAWHRVICSLDAADTGKRHLYVDEVPDLTADAYVDDTIAFDLADVGIGGAPSGADRLTGRMADLTVWPGQYVDLSVAANRRALDTPATARTLLGDPIMEFGGAAASWHTNLGTGGAFSVTMGTLTDAASDPLPRNMVVASEALVADAPPNAIKLVAQIAEVDAIALGTDLIFEVSRDDGTTWTEADMTARSMHGGITFLESDEVDVSGQPSGTDVMWRITTANNKMVEIHGVYIHWR